MLCVKNRTLSYERITIMKKAISLLLAVLMLLSLSAVAFADNGSDVEMKYKDYQSYLNIGDSIARGCGIPGHHETTYYNDAWNNSNGGHAYANSFPALVANEFGKAEPDHNFHYMGMRTIETLYALGGDVDPWTYDEFCNKDFGSHIRGAGGIDEVKDALQVSAASSDLITLEIGCNDVFYSALSLSGLEKAFGSGNTDELLDALGVYLKLTATGFAGFCEYYPQIVERIFELQAQAGRTADDFDLVLVGVYNPYSNCPVTEDIFIPVMEATDVLTGSMNALLKEIAAKYDNVYYADIAAVQTPVTTGAISFLDSFTNGDGTINTHPTEEGYKYVARQILNVLPQEAVYPNTYIQLNLPTNFTVSKVLLDGKSVSFTQDGYNLIVPNSGKLHATMTVTGKDDSGHSMLFFYQLAYHSDTGYVSYRIASTNDMSMTINRIVTSVKNITSTLFNGIANLFTGK